MKFYLKFDAFQGSFIADKLSVVSKGGYAVLETVKHLCISRKNVAGEC